MNMNCGQCFVACYPVSNAPFGFIYVYVEDEQTRKVSIHGGGWLHDHAMLNYRAYVINNHWGLVIGSVKKNQQKSCEE